MYFTVSDGCYSQQIISATAKESLIPYNRTQRAPETQNLSYCNTECNVKPNQKNVKLGSAFLKNGL